MDQLSLLPTPFFLGLTLIGILLLHAWNGRHQGWGIPTGMVLATVGAWYYGDGLYNDYSEYQERVGNEALVAGWWQVLWFLVVFGVIVQPVNYFFNQRFLRYRSRTMLYYETNLLQTRDMQRQLDKVAWLLFPAWLLLMGVALLRVKFDFIGLFAPYLGEKQYPWFRGRMGGGIDAVLSLAGYLQILLTASFGIFAAVCRNSSTRTMALMVCVLALPYYFLDRTRNTMIAVALPGLLAWVFFRLRSGPWARAAVLVVAFLATSFWFSFVLANRNEGSISSQLGRKEALERAEETRHEGLSMFSELGYMNSFIKEGKLKPNWGKRYFAELVNPIPRALWPGKPTVGLEYAVARGFASAKGSKASGGVHASIATGMIGQGIVNFGVFLGPMVAAFLMSLWVAILARQDLLGRDPARMLLFSVGMILTFNMGRDITLLVLYPFVFGWGGLQAAIYFGMYRPIPPVPLQQKNINLSPRHSSSAPDGGQSAPPLSDSPRS